jgi:ATP-dependent Lhr-like helicase
MPRAWPAFFGRFGRLTSVQRAVAPGILQGQDVLVCSATASGKTEAACAPLVERNIDRASPWTILYVTPTRALVNDLWARLDMPLRELGLEVARRTGEYRVSAKSTASVLLTTPESFDSMLCRGRTPNGHILANVVAVVIDEAHLLYGTPRGEQVRWLLTRLRRLRRQATKVGWASDAAVQVVALSATLPDPLAVKEALLPDGEIISVPGGREIEVITLLGMGAQRRTEVVVPAYLASRPAGEKLLVFCNTRKRVDELTLVLREHLASLHYEVVAHHGSLPKQTRESAEDLARTQERIVVCATSTLELGIDIGDIDVVVLDGPPPDIPALLQRVGRGNRRTGTTRVLPCWSNRGEHLIQESMLSAAAEGWLGPMEAGPSHAVIRQQVASYIFQAPSGRRSEGHLLSLATDGGLSEVAPEVLSYMADMAELVPADTGLKLGKDWLDRAARGDVHSMIESPPGATVVDARTGEQVASGVRVQTRGGMNIGGRTYRVRGGSTRRVEVEASRGRGVEATWRYASAGARLGSAGQPQAVRRYLGVAENVWPVVRIGDRAHIFHFGGTRRRAVLTLAAPEGVVEAITDWAIILQGAVTKQQPDWILNATEAALTLRIRSSIGALERMLARPRANAMLPDEVRYDEVRGWLRLEEELGAIRAALWRRPEEPISSHLQALASVSANPVAETGSIWE